MAGYVVVGTQWGDEGKGKIIDVLSEKAENNIKTEFEQLFLHKHNKNINYTEIKKIV